MISDIGINKMDNIIPANTGSSDETFNEIIFEIEKILYYNMRWNKKNVPHSITSFINLPVIIITHTIYLYNVHVFKRLCWKTTNV